MRINSAIPKTANGYSKAYREKGLMGNGDLQNEKIKQNYIIRNTYVCKRGRNERKVYSIR